MYRGITWDDTVTLNRNAGDRTVYLTWNVFTDLPPETVWEIGFDEGPSDDQPSRITDIPVDALMP